MTRRPGLENEMEVVRDDTTIEYPIGANITFELEA